ncbi:MAG TPA: isocitrate lyase/PEP mutase family protein [Candidatus Binatia bacterium]|nr:isocitrate lyase/PEP mutase family protein [Candidatus Binatia bacterium]
MEGKSALRELLRRKELIVAPGVYTALTAKLVEQAGFRAAYMSGYCTSASMYGLPDTGLVTMTEMLANLRLLAGAVEIPLIGDADTGYGNPINVARTVREYEKAGAAAIHIEDQVWPKRCGHMKGKEVIAVDEMAGKIRAAVDSRRSDDFVIIARTDAIAVEGLEAAIGRCHAYAEAGADVVFADGQRTMEHVERLPRECAPVPCMINLGPLTPPLSVPEIRNLGYAIAIFPGVCLAPAVAAIQRALQDLREAGNGSLGDGEEALRVFAAFNELLGADAWIALDRKYRPHPRDATPSADGG